MTENKTKPELSPLERVEQNLQTAFNAWSEEINVSELPKALQRKHRVVRDKTAKLMYEVHQYCTTEHKVGRPSGGLTKSMVRNELKNASPEQLEAIAEILGTKPETEVSSVSADLEKVEEVNDNE